MRTFFSGKSQRGFTLVEVIVVSGIIALFMSVALASASQVRQNARDKVRAGDLEQIKSAIQLYAATYKEYPCESAANCDNQAVSMNGKIGEGGNIDTLLAEFMSTVPVDPLGPGDTDHYYYIDPNQTCGGNPNQIVIFANTMETNKFKNFEDTICTSWEGEGGAGNSDSYMIVIGDSSDI